jgi:hypothetical protein
VRHVLFGFAGGSSLPERRRWLGEALASLRASDPATSLLSVVRDVKMALKHDAQHAVARTSAHRSDKV